MERLTTFPNNDDYSSGHDYHISKENESGQSELVNQEAGELDMSSQQFGSEDVFTEIPNQSSSVEGVLN